MSTVRAPHPCRAHTAQCQAEQPSPRTANFAGRAESKAARLPPSRMPQAQPPHRAPKPARSAPPSGSDIVTGRTAPGTTAAGEKLTFAPGGKPRRAQHTLPENAPPTGDYQLSAYVATPPPCTVCAALAMQPSRKVRHRTVASTTVTPSTTPPAESFDVPCTRPSALCEPRRRPRPHCRRHATLQHVPRRHA